LKITWLGHSCFLIVDSEGRKLLSDPYSNFIGYPPIKERVDVITISNNSFDHNNTQDLPGIPIVLSSCGTFDVSDFHICGLPSFCDNTMGCKRGENIIFTIEIDNIKLCHLGDLGHELSGEDIEKLGKVDVLFIPVGGNYTLDAKKAAKVAKVINSKIIIPMHYRTTALSIPLSGVEDFIVNMKNGEKKLSDTYELTSIPEGYNNVILLNYKTS
jgi:L-ascorbate metabolism protein UlaG (beta-lactamase superfamily)